MAETFAFSDRKMIEFKIIWTYLSGGPQIGIWPKIWDLTQFLGFDSILDLQPLKQGIGERGYP